MSDKTSFPELEEKNPSITRPEPVGCGFHGMPQLEIIDERPGMTSEEKNEQLSVMLTRTDMRNLYITMIMRQENAYEDRGQWVLFFI